MDPYLVYSRYRDDAFASQLTSASYTVFVAMPFRDRYSYRASDIYTEVIQPAAAYANQLLASGHTPTFTRRFAVPRRIDDQPQTGRDIGGEIAKAIMMAHMIVADLTFANDGVMLEVGAALALKPTTHVILITQGDPAELHFNIKGNAVLPYTPSTGTERIAQALVAAAGDFETRRGEYLTHLSRELPRDSIWLMNWYGRLKCGKLFGRRVNSAESSFYEGTGWQAFLESVMPEGKNPASERLESSVRFQLALRELLKRRLLWTDYRAQTPQPGLETCEYRGTRLGWMFIEQHWPDLRRPETEVDSSDRQASAAT
ncbi:MAG: hypothetical protein U0570_10795 [Phycisphaerales bacterium]